MVRSWFVVLLFVGLSGCGSEGNKVLTPVPAAAPMTEEELAAEMASTPIDLEKEMQKPQ